MKLTLVCALSAVLASPLGAATVWIGNANGGDGLSFFQEANWDTDGNTAAPYTTPAANTINPGTATTSAVGILSVTGATLTNIGSPVFGDGFGMTLSNASISTDTTLGTTGVTGGAASILDLTNGSTYSSQFIDLDVTVNVGAASNLILRGTGTPVNTNSFVYLASGGTLTFSGGSPSSLNPGQIFNSNFGQAYATTGDISPYFTFTGTQAAPLSITAIPEPAGITLLGLGGLGLLLRRRR